MDPRLNGLNLELKQVKEWVESMVNFGLPYLKTPEGVLYELIYDLLTGGVDIEELRNNLLTHLDLKEDTKSERR